MGDAMHGWLIRHRHASHNETAAENGDIDVMAYCRGMRWQTLAGFMPVFLLTGATPNSSGAEFSSSVDPSEGWKLTSGSKDVALYSRARTGSKLKEFRAIGSIDAPTYAVHAVIDDFEDYSVNRVSRGVKIGRAHV